MTIHHGFESVSERYITELKTLARLYRHVRTGTQLLSLVNDDENKCFGITFRTPPADSTGVAHILEHSVLCGSRKYPVKEPFVELLKGSLKTFLNAFTYPDKTCYPVASQNVEDFYNLVDVYLDAVFHPRLTPFVLQQEGWHYELESPDSPMSFKGVVFNEMKGVYSSPDSLLAEYSQHSLFPDNTYGLDSGGDPAHIPDLTFEAFLEFHRRFLPILPTRASSSRAMTTRTPVSGSWTITSRTSTPWRRIRTSPSSSLSRPPGVSIGPSPPGVRTPTGNLKRRA